MSADTHYRFRIYVAGDGPHSAQALANLRTICADYLPERHEVEVVDVLREPQRALADGVMLTPLLVKLSPAPMRRIVGTLSQREFALQTLGLST
ncbi:hypothetical protein BH09VER1_BH09VER1_01700 [soil metagenome]